MKKATLVSLVASIVATGMLAVGATTFAASPAPSSHPQSTLSHSKSHGHRKMMHHRGRITAITSTTVTVRYHGHRTHTFDLNQVTVRALAYPVSASLLQVGAPVVAYQNQVVLLPVARGTLTAASNGSWTLTTPKKQTLTLAKTPSTLLGVSSVTNGAKVMAFGKRSGTTLTATALAAPPAHVRATVVSNQNGIVTVKTPKATSVTLTAAKLPMSKWVGKLKVGRHVILVLDPVTNTPLAVLPVSHRPYQRLTRFAVGKLTSASTGNFVVTTSLGTETIPLTGKTVKVIWPHHPSATLSQVPQGTPVMVHEAGPTSLIVRVF